MADVSRLEALVDNLLEVGRLDAQGFQAHPKATQLQTTVPPLIATFQNNFRENGEVRFSVHDAPIFAQVDVSTLPTIILNLLDNLFIQY